MTESSHSAPACSRHLPVPMGLLALCVKSSAARAILIAVAKVRILIMQFPQESELLSKAKATIGSRLAPACPAPPPTPPPPTPANRSTPVYCHVAAFGEMLRGKNHQVTLAQLKGNQMFPSERHLRRLYNFKVPLSGVHSIRRGAGRSAGLSG